MAGDRDRDSAFRRYKAPFEVVVEHVESDQTMHCTEYDGDEEDNPMHPDTTVSGEPFGIASRAPKDVEQLAVESKAGIDWVLTANVDRPSVSAEGAVTFFDMYKSGDTWVVGNQIELTGSDGINLKARSGKKLITYSATYLGSASAAEAFVLGTTLATDFGVFLSASSGWSKALNDLKTSGNVTAYATAMEILVNALITALANWLSTKHKLDS